MGYLIATKRLWALLWVLLSVTPLILLPACGASQPLTAANQSGLGGTNGGTNGNNTGGTGDTSWGTPNPTITSISPTSGPVAGGTSVTIYGNHFDTDSTVSFGTTQASSVVLVSSTELTAVTPAASAAGNVTVQVSNSSGNVANLTNGFQYTSSSAGSNGSSGSSGSSGSNGSGGSNGGVSATAVCQVQIQGACNNHPELTNFSGPDTPGMQSENSGGNAGVCAQRASDYFGYCGNSAPVKTTFVSTGAVTSVGCTVHIEGNCAKFPNMSNFNGPDTWGMENTNAGTSAAACAQRASDYFGWCGYSATVVTTFGLTGAQATSAAPLPCGALPPNTTISMGQSFTTCDGSYEAVMQHDGNFVVYGPSGPIWSTAGAGALGTQAVMQGDGNFVLYLNGVATWSSGTYGHPGAQLFIGGDGNLVVSQPTSAGGWVPEWSWKTGLTTAEVFAHNDPTTQDWMSSQSSNEGAPSYQSYANFHGYTAQWSASMHPVGRCFVGDPSPHHGMDHFDTLDVSGNCEGSGGHWDGIVYFLDGVQEFASQVPVWRCRNYVHTTDGAPHAIWTWRHFTAVGGCPAGWTAEGVIGWAER